MIEDYEPDFTYITCPECGIVLSVDRNEFTNLKDKFYMFEPQSIKIDFECSGCDYHMEVEI